MKKAFLLILAVLLFPVTAPAATLEDGLKVPYPAPELAGIEGWINSGPLTLAGLKGKVVLLDFWTYSCVNCVRTFPYLIGWDKKYRDKGLVIIGVHSPEFGFEGRPRNIQEAVNKRGITYPVAQDNSMQTWRAYSNLYWPAHYLIDKEGRVVYTHFGEGKYDVTENNIRQLLGLPAGDVTVPENAEIPALPGQTPETYLGTARADSYVLDDKVELPLHHWTLSGEWKKEPEKITAMSPGATLRLHFKAKKVYVVMGSANGQPIQVTISLNGKGHDIIVREHDLYPLMVQGSDREGVLEIRTQQPELEAYAFTFGG